MNDNQGVFYNGKKDRKEALPKAPRENTWQDREERHRHNRFPGRPTTKGTNKTTEKTMNDDEHNYLWNRHHKIKHRLELSVLYHRERERFLSLATKWITAIAIIGGSAAFAGVADHTWMKYTGLLVAASATLSLVFGLPDAARLHGELAMRYSLLLADMAARGERDFTEKDLNRWEAEIHHIETEEPPSLPMLVRLCQNRLKIAAGQPDMTTPISPWQRLSAHLFGCAGKI